MRWYGCVGRQTGTSQRRIHSCNFFFIDMSTMLSLCQAFEFAKDYCGSGNGPMFLEVETYRYHGHSMSDPGLTYVTAATSCATTVDVCDIYICVNGFHCTVICRYRERSEVQDVRTRRDCIKGRTPQCFERSPYWRTNCHHRRFSFCYFQALPHAFWTMTSQQRET